METMKTAIIIPVYNPDKKLNQLIAMIDKQTIKDVSVMIIDSGSNKGYIDAIHSARYQIIDINASDFNHGGTRQFAANQFPDAEVYIYLTQDAVLADKYALENLISIFKNERIGCAYGRQLPHAGASFFASSARKINYGERSYIRFWGDRHKYGMKTVFISNSFAAYRRCALISVGGFPKNTILSEDMYVAAKMLMSGWGIAYQANARVYHSHNYTIWQEFKRYFDIGVFHSREKWIRDFVGGGEKNGIEFLKAEIDIIKKKPNLLILMIARDGMKYLGYKLGLHEKILSINLKKCISSNSRYWER